MNKFKYDTFEIKQYLPSSWREDILEFAKEHEKAIVITPKSVTSREIYQYEPIETLVVDGEIIKNKLSWLYDLYSGLFFEFAQKCSNEELSIAQNPLYAINLNIQRGTQMRYECHVDSNPLQGLLYVTTHLQNEGGELVVSNDSSALGTEQIEIDCVRIYPASGNLVFFDAREHPHFVTALTNDDDVRISIAMNFYTPSSPESQRPKDLNNHLFGNS